MTKKCFIIGILFCIWINIGGLWGELFVKGSSLCYTAILPIVNGSFIFVVIFNQILKKFLPGLTLENKELIVIYIMGIIAGVIPISFTTSLLPLLIAPFYYANEINKYGEIFLPYLKKLSVFPLDKEAIRWFFEGLPVGVSIPWRIWVRPLTFWIIFGIFYYLFLFLLSKILSTQWIYKEKLNYSLNKLPLFLIGIGQDINVFKKNLFWLGMGIPCFIHFWNGLSNFFPFLHSIILSKKISLFYGLFSIPVIINFTMMGFAYFIPCEILLSLWFFYLLFSFELFFINRLGLDITSGTVGTLELWISYGCPSIAHQLFGSLIVFSIYSLWMARREFIDKSNRNLLKALILISLILIWFLRFTGLSISISIIFLISVILIYTGLSKIIAQCGLTSTQTPLIPQSFLVKILSTPVPNSILTGFSLSTVWLGETGVNMMNSLVHQEHLTTLTKLNSKKISVFIFLSIILSILVSTTFLIYLAYNKGGLNLSKWNFQDAPQWPYIYFSMFASSFSSPIKIRILFSLFGVLLTTTLIFLRNNFFWWPIHPVGTTIALTWPMGYQWFSIFIIWLIKSLLIKYGGGKIYKKFVPFAIGLISGELMMVIIWTIINGLKGITGYVIFLW